MKFKDANKELVLAMGWCSLAQIARFHSTGGENKSRLVCIVYLAAKVEKRIR
jgi:hypothetical protein